MDSQKESRGQKWGWPGIGSKNRDVGVQKGQGMAVFSLYSLASQILERSAMKKIQVFHLKKRKLRLSDRVTKREN